MERGMDERMDQTGSVDDPWPEEGEHSIDHSQIPPGVLKIAEALRAKGRRTLIVGGAVRDMHLGKTPRDYDLVTDASWKEVKKSLNCIIVGKRFRVAHCWPNRRHDQNDMYELVAMVGWVQAELVLTRCLKDITLVLTG